MLLLIAHMLLLTAHMLASLLSHLSPGNECYRGKKIP